MNKTRQVAEIKISQYFKYISTNQICSTSTNFLNIGLIGVKESDMAKSLP